MKKIILALVATLALAACSSDPTPAPTSYTAAQIAQCQAAEDSFSASGWMGQSMTTDIGGNVAQDRGAVEQLIKESLGSESAVTPPSLASLQWTTMVTAMRADEPLFAAPMTQDQYDTALNALWAKISAFDVPCQAAISWGQDNLPQ